MENQQDRCANCGSMINDPKASVERDGKTYCSESCAQGAQRSQQPPKTPIV